MCVLVFENDLLAQFRNAEFLMKCLSAFFLLFAFMLHGLDFIYEVQVPFRSILVDLSLYWLNLLRN